MTQTSGRFFDEIGKFLTGAAGAAQGFRREMESMMRSQAEKMLSELDVVQREEFEATKAMAQKAREENDRLRIRLAALEEQIADLEEELAAPQNPRPIKKRTIKRSY